jgi:lysophospholipase L1-like esterase
MNKTSVLFLMLTLPLLFLQGQSAALPRVEGKSVFPVFADNGDFVFLCAKENKGIALGKQEKPLQNETQSERLLIEGICASPSIKKDQQNRMWVSWEALDSGKKDIFLASLEDDRLKHQINVSHDFDGDNLEPSFAFDLDGNAWVTWINNSQNLFRVLVKDIKNSKTWQVNSPHSAASYTPRIAIGRMNTVWIFWVGTQDGKNALFCNRFEDDTWTGPHLLNKKPTYPQISPEVSVDGDGYPWVVWSTYDGNDYEISYSHWNGMRWSTESRITDNNGISDVFPHITFFPGNIPVFVWSRAKTRSQIFLKYRMGEDWSRDIRISRDEGWNRNPKLATFHNKLGIAWENVKNSRHHIRTEMFSSFNLSFPEKKEKRAGLFPKEDFFFSKKNHQPILNLTSNEWDENEYLAFGDSITYGVISRTWFPDKGYVPRLERLLREEFIPAEVPNRGIPGEQTVEGLARLGAVLEQDKSKYILIMEGTNDMTGGIPSETAAFNIQEMIKLCLQSGVFPLVATIIPRSDQLWHSGIRQKTLLFNDLIKGIVPSYAVPLVDQYQSFFDYPDGFRALFSDGAHPNEPGYQLMAEEWFEKIKKIPLPPINLGAERKINKLLFFDEQLNIITWERNPLIPPSVQLAQYHIFRKEADKSDDEFAWVTSVSAETHMFMDRNVMSTKIYHYRIQVEDTEGTRGPVSATVVDR